MRRRVSRAVLTAVPLALAVSLLPAAGATAARPERDGAAAAEARLRDDASGAVRIRRAGGDVTFVGTTARTDVDNPAVARGASVHSAARAHLDRYGPLLGTDRPGTGLTGLSQAALPGGGDVVRYQQEVGGVPVLGGGVVVTLRPDRELGSFAANLSHSDVLRAAQVSEAAARRVAEGVVERRVGGPARADDHGRWVWDPEAVNWPAGGPVRGVWRFEVRVGDAVRRMVLVDDRSGGVVADVDLVQHVDRIVCDQQNAPITDPPVCTPGTAARSEGGPASGVADVDSAFDLAGATSDFYAQAAGVDLTALIGHGDVPKLASTVRVCLSGGACPYGNAYWNGLGMFYGQGYAGADDVVAHEMTHGVIERTSNLIYWDQSGAINESLADIIGEIVDHRNPSPGDDPSEWLMGEDLPIGAIRSAANPPLYGDPDRVTSVLWEVDDDYSDNGGVHYNSGVGNKTFHLISQGGSFNGQSVTGIDAGDATLTASALLWTRVIWSIGTFADYAHLADVLEQSCADLVAGGELAAGDCTSVASAIAATELRTPPVTSPVRDAPRTCPGDTFPRTLLDSEAGADPSSLFTAAAGWGRSPGTEVNSAFDPFGYSGDTSWVAENPPFTDQRSLVASAPVPLPAGQASYLAFRSWYVFEASYWSGALRFWDGGSVELRRGDGSTAFLEGEAWQFGPSRTLDREAAGRTVFGGSSRGWVGSRVDLSGFAGQGVRPQFTMHSDELYGAPGWYLDDIVVYTCDAELVPTAVPTVTGTARVDETLVASDAAWNHGGATTTYQWRRDGTAIPGATGTDYRAVPADVGRQLSVRATGTFGQQTASVTTDVVGPVTRGLLLAPASVGVRGRPRKGRVLRALPGTWAPSPVTLTYRWYRGSRPIPRATRPTYRLRTKDVGKRLRVRIVGTRPGYTTVVRISPRTKRIRP